MPSSTQMVERFAHKCQTEQSKSTKKFADKPRRQHGWIYTTFFRRINDVKLCISSLSWIFFQSRQVEVSSARSLYRMVSSVSTTTSMAALTSAVRGTLSLNKKESAGSCWLAGTAMARWSAFTYPSK